MTIKQLNPKLKGIALKLTCPTTGQRTSAWASQATNETAISPSREPMVYAFLTLTVKCPSCKDYHAFTITQADLLP